MMRGEVGLAPGVHLANRAGAVLGRLGATFCWRKVGLVGELTYMLPIGWNVGANVDGSGLRRTETGGDPRMARNWLARITPE